MERPQVAKGVDGLQIWIITANVMNEQSLTAEQRVVLQFSGWVWG
jgi:hypothetical protein